jgi:hypothetical protein
MGWKNIIAGTAFSILAVAAQGASAAYFEQNASCGQGRGSCVVLFQVVNSAPAVIITDVACSILSSAAAKAVLASVSTGNPVPPVTRFQWLPIQSRGSKPAIVARTRMLIESGHRAGISFLAREGPGIRVPPVINARCQIVGETVE